MPNYNTYIDIKENPLLKHLIMFMMCLGAISNTFAYNFWTIGTQEGLSQLSVLGIHQDRLGRMWFGTEEGLNVFDGNRLKVFHSSASIQDEHDGHLAFLGNSNYPIVEDKDGNIFFRSDNSLIKYDIVTQTFSHIAYKGFFALSACDGEVWLGTSRRLYKLVDDSLHCMHELEYAIDAKSLYVRDSIAWMGCENELLKIDLRHKTHTSVLKACVWSIYEDVERNLWIATRKHGIYRIGLDERIEEISICENKGKCTVPDEVRCFVEDGKGNLWIGTFNGLIRYSLKTKKSIRLTTRNGLSHNSVYALYADRNDNIWVGTYYGGVNCFNINNNNFLYFLNEDLGTPFVGSMVEDNDNRLWICTEGAGLKCYNKTTHDFTNIPIQWTANGITTIHPNLKTICFDKKNNVLYIGTTTGGMCRYSLFNGKLKHYNLDHNIRNLLGSSVDKLCIHGDYLYLKVRKGIYKMHIPTEKITPLVEGKSYHNTWVRTFTVDSKGYIWIAGYNDIRIVNLNYPDEVYKLYNSIDGLGRYPITCISESPSGEMILATRGAGVYKSVHHKSFELVDPKLDKLFCYDVKFSQNGQMLTLTDKGLYVCDMVNQHIQIIGLQDYLSPLKAINIGCQIYVSKDSTIYVGGTNGMVAYRDRHFAKQQHSYDIYIASLLVNGKKLDSRTQTLVFSEKRNTLQLEVGTTNFYNGINNGIYRYKLEGYDTDWRQTDNAHIEYHNVPIGNYSLVIEDGNEINTHVFPIRLSIEDVNGDSDRLFYIVLAVILMLIGVIVIINRRKSVAVIDTSENQEGQQSSIALRNEDICGLLEELQKEQNHKLGEGILFVYLRRQKGDLYYRVYRTLFKELMAHLIQFILDSFKDGQNSIEIIPYLKGDTLYVRIVDYVNGPISDADLARMSALCADNDSVYDNQSRTGGCEKNGEVNIIRALCLQNDAFIDIKCNTGFAADFTVSIHNEPANEAQLAADDETSTHQEEQKEPELNVDKDFIAQVDHIILENISNEHFNIGDIISAQYMNRTFFYKKFKEETGMSPNEYLNCFRLCYARDMFIDHPDYQVADVAYKVGFGSPRYLGRCFKKKFGIPPIAYRKIFSEGNK